MPEKVHAARFGCREALAWLHGSVGLGLGAGLWQPPPPGVFESGSVQLYCVSLNLKGEVRTVLHCSGEVQDVLQLATRTTAHGEGHHPHGQTAPQPHARRCTSGLRNTLHWATEATLA